MGRSAPLPISPETTSVGLVRSGDRTSGGRGMACRDWPGGLAIAGRWLTTAGLAVLVAGLAVTVTASAAGAVDAIDARASQGQGAATCATAGVAGAGDLQIPMRFLSVVRRGAYAVDVTAVRGWTVTGMVVEGAGGYNLYRPGVLGLSASPPWHGLRAPLGPDGGIQRITGGFACGSPTRSVPDQADTEDTDCLRLIAHRNAFTYTVGGHTYEYAGFITFPQPMTSVVVTAKPAVTIPEGCAVPFSLAAYETQGPTWESSGQQRFLDHSAAAIDAAHRSITLTAQSPRCFGQIDLYLGRRVYDGGSGAGHGPLPDRDRGVGVPRGLVGAWNGSLDCSGPTPTSSTPASPGSGTTTVINTAVTQPAVGTTEVLGARSDDAGSGDDSGVLAASGASSSLHRLVPTGILLVVLGFGLLRAGPTAPVHFSPVMPSGQARTPRPGA